MDRTFELNVLLCGEEVVCCSFDEDYIVGRMEDLNDIGFAAVCEECGRDPEDLTPEEAGEMEFMQGYEGDYYTIETIDVPADKDDTEGNVSNLYRLSDDEVTLDDGTEVYIGDLVSSFVSGDLDTYYDEE